MHTIYKQTTLCKSEVTAVAKLGGHADCQADRQYDKKDRPKKTK